MLFQNSLSLTKNVILVEKHSNPFQFISFL